MKHYEVNFVDRTVETITADSLPPGVGNPYLISDEQVKPTWWWSVGLMRLDGETNSMLVPYGRIHINLNNVTFIKET